MGEDVFRDCFCHSDCEDDEAGGDEAHHPGSLYEKFFDEAVIDLRKIPLAHPLLLEQAANDAKVVRYMLFLVLVPQHHSMEVEHSELKTLHPVQAAQVLH